MKLLEYSDYKILLKESLKTRKKIGLKPYTFQEMAKACRIQKAYLSKVLNGEGQLNDDQIYLACNFLGFNQEEREYVFLLAAEEKSAVQSRKAEISKQIRKIRSEAELTHKHISANSKITENEDLHEYYRNAYNPIVHLFLSIDRYKKDLSLIARDLRVSEVFISRIITNLQKLAIVEIVDGNYVVKKRNFHLPSGSLTNQNYQTLIRLKSLERLQYCLADASYRFAATFSCSDKTRKIIKQKFLDFLKSIERSVTDDKPEDVFQMNFDLFGWSCDE